MRAGDVLRMLGALGTVLFARLLVRVFRPKPLVFSVATSDFLLPRLRQARLVAASEALDSKVELHAQSDNMGATGSIWKIRCSVRDQSDDVVRMILLIAKTNQTADLKTAVFTKYFDPFSREQEFFEDVAPGLPQDAAVPAFVAAVARFWTNEHVLLLAEADDSQRNDSVDGCGTNDVKRVAGAEGISLPQAEAAVAWLAALHSRHWSGTNLPQPLKMLSDSVVPAVAADLWMRGGGSQVAEVGPHSKKLVETVLALGKASDGTERPWTTFIKSMTRTGPTTLLHGDFHHGNILFGRNIDNDLVLSVIDWTTWRVGPALWDLAYLATYCVDPELRRSNERRWVAEYVRQLQERGVTYTSTKEPESEENTAWDDYLCCAAVTATLGAMVSGLFASKRLPPALTTSFPITCQRWEAMVSDHKLEHVAASFLSQASNK